MKDIYGFVIFLSVFQLIGCYSLRDEYPGPWCTKRRGEPCCNNRQDSCSVPIAQTLCYCDQFCNRTHSSDCCPDYSTVCLGIPDPPAQIVTCRHNGIHFSPFDPPIRDNCNLCTCNTDSSVVCEQKACLLTENTINTVNSLSNSLGWTASNYTEFWGRSYDDGLMLRLGTFEPINVRAMKKLSNKPPPKLPLHFNSLDHWRGLIRDVRDQGWCGSSWAMSTSSVASDRFSIQSNAKENIELSPQNLLSCDIKGQRGCHGGHLDRAWNYLKKTGVVEDSCYPYKASHEKCKLYKGINLESSFCRPMNTSRKELYKTGPAYSLNNETDIMIEIYRRGPVQATFQVYRDFFAYSNGIYRHSNTGDSLRSGFHSVKIIGWGEQRRGYEVTKYWVAANSWGNWWGESGYFRILRGQNHCGIESYVFAVWAHVFEHNKHIESRG